MPYKTSPVYQFKISLNHIRPPIWRRILVAGNTPLGCFKQATVTKL